MIPIWIRSERHLVLCAGGSKLLENNFNSIHAVVELEFALFRFLFMLSEHLAKHYARPRCKVDGFGMRFD